MAFLGQMYQKGWGVLPPNDKNSYFWLRAAMKRGDIESHVFFSSLYPDACPKPLPPCTNPMDFETSVLQLPRTDTSGVSTVLARAGNMQQSEAFLDWAKELNDTLLDREEEEREGERERRRVRVLADVQPPSIPSRIANIPLPTTTLDTTDRTLHDSDVDEPVKAQASESGSDAETPPIQPRSEASMIAFPSLPVDPSAKENSPPTGTKAGASINTARTSTAAPVTPQPQAPPGGGVPKPKKVDPEEKEALMDKQYADIFGKYKAKLKVTFTCLALSPSRFIGLP
jgi:hypothetical protein